MSQNQNQKNQKQGRQNRSNDQRRDQQHREVMDVVFVQDPPGSDRLVSYLGDLTVYPATRQFRPIAGTHYQCDVLIKEGGRRAIGRAKPCLPYTLSPEEWLPKEALRQCLVEEIRFKHEKKEGKDRAIAFSGNGQIVFPDRGFDPKPGETYACMLREHGTVAFAIPLPREALSNSTALVTIGDALGLTDLRALQHIVLVMARKRPGVAVAKSDGDLVTERSYRNVYDLLSVKDDQGRIMVQVTDRSNEADINKAYKQGVPRLHPDKVEQRWASKGMQMPLELRKNAENFFTAFTAAKEAALDLLKVHKEKAEKAKAQRRQERQRKEAAQPTGTPVQAETQQVEAPQEAPAATEQAAEKPTETEAIEAAQPTETPVQAETQQVEAPQAVEAAPVSVDDENVKAAAMAKLTLEEFLAKDRNYQNHFRKAVRREARSQQAAAVPAVKPKAKKESLKGQGLAALASLKVGEEK